MRDLMPVAQGDRYRDFEADVLDNLVKHKASMHGCPVWKVEVKQDGGIAVWFHGARDGTWWEGALKFSYPLLAQKKWAWDINAVTETALRISERATEASRGQAFIQRAAVH